MIVVGDGGVLGNGLLITLVEIGQKNVADAEADAADFIGIGGTDAFEGAADFGVAAGFFTDAVEGAMRGEDKLSFFRDIEVFGPIYPPIGEFLELLAEHDRVEDDAVADDIENMRVKDAAGHLVQDVLYSVEEEGVTGVGAALEAGDGVVGRREHV